MSTPNSFPGTPSTVPEQVKDAVGLMGDIAHGALAEKMNAPHADRWVHTPVELSDPLSLGRFGEFGPADECYILTDGASLDKWPLGAEDDGRKPVDVLGFTLTQEGQQPRHVVMGPTPEDMPDVPDAGDRGPFLLTIWDPNTKVMTTRFLSFEEFKGITIKPGNQTPKLAPPLNGPQKQLLGQVGPMYTYSRTRIKSE